MNGVEAASAALDAVARYDRWVVTPTLNTCKGCVFLSRIGPLPRDIGPRPPLHEHCRCERVPIDIEAMTPWEKIQLVLWADRNRRAMPEILRQARLLQGQAANGLSKGINANRSGRVGRLS